MDKFKRRNAVPHIELSCRGAILSRLRSIHLHDISCNSNKHRLARFKNTSYTHK